MHEHAQLRGRYEVVCYTAGGRVEWRAPISNLWTTQGKNDVLQQYFGGTAVANVYVGLISSVSFSAVSAADTAAQINGTNGWKEASDSTNLPRYSQSTRPELMLGTASGGSRATSTPCQFSITEAGTVEGCFLVTSSVKAGAAGKLLTAGLFDSGEKVVSAGQILNVTWTGSL